MFRSSERNPKSPSAIQKIEMALSGNKALPSVLLGRRAFERESREELLTLVYTDIREPIVWGHVFEKDGRFVSLFVGFETWFNGRDSKQIFERFWHHLNYFGDWYPLDSFEGSGSEVYREFQSYADAVSGLAEMISNFDIEKVGSPDSEIYQTDYRILGVYPFPRPGVTLPDYPKNKRGGV